MTGPNRFPWLVVVLVAVVALAVGAIGTWFLTRPAPMSIDGVRAPDAKCRSNIEDVGHPWVRNGVWVGYVDGKVQTMVSSDAQALSMAGRDLSGIWLCPPKSEWG